MVDESKVALIAVKVILVLLVADLVWVGFIVKQML